MIRTVSIFVATFVAGALIALVARAALFEPHAGQEPAASAGGEYAPLVTNALTPPAPAPAAADAAPAADPHAGHRTPPPPARSTPAADPHAGHGSPGPQAAATPAAAPGTPVNTICAICGMDVDPSLPTAQYQGQTIGFGCRMCPPKFKANPDKYGPSYLRNERFKS